MKKNEFTLFLGGILAILALVAVTVTLLFASSNPANSYELSIYQSTSQLVFFLLIFSLAIGLFITFYWGRQRFWVIGVVLLLITRISIQWLPFIRGYYTLHGDHMSQIGYIKDVLNTGFINPEDFYPATHILLSSLVLITHLPLVPVANYSTVMMSTFSILWLYLVSKSVLRDKEAQKVAVALSVAIIFDRYSLYLMPNGWSIFFVPLIFYIFLRESEFESLSWKILLILVLFIIPFFHLLTALYMIVAFIIISIWTFFLNCIKENSWQKKFQEIPAVPTLILIVSFLAWISSFKIFYSNLRILYMAILSGNDPKKFLDQIEEAISKLWLTTADFIQYLINSMGHIFIVLALSVIAFLLFIRSGDYTKKDFGNLLIFFIISACAALLYLFRIFGVVPGLGAIAGERFLAYVVVFAPLFVGYLGSKLFSKTKKTKLQSIYVVIILLSSVLSIYAFYPSPNTYEPSAQVTLCDVYSASWTFSKMDKDSNYLSSILTPIYRFSDLLYGELHRQYLPPIKYIGDHFGYGRGDYVGLVVESDTYLVINQIDRVVYNTVWAPVGRFNEGDFYKLYYDISALKLYSNGGGEVWLIGKL